MKKMICLLLALSCVFLFSACGDRDTEGTDANEAGSSQNEDGGNVGEENNAGGDDESFPTLELSTWNGTWNSMMELLRDPAFEAAYPIWAEDYDEPTTPEQVKQDYEASYRTDFASMVVDGDKISFFSSPAAANDEIAGEALFTGTYTAEGLESVSGDGYSYAWYKFKASEEGPYQYVLLLPPESEEEEGFAHWHYRYGSEGYTALLSLDEWWPTAVLSKTTAQEVVKLFSGE